MNWAIGLRNFTETIFCLFDNHALSRERRTWEKGTPFMKTYLQKQ